MRNQLRLFLIAAGVIAVDQLSKWQVRGRMAIGDTVEIHPWLRDVFDLAHTTNTGAAFGMFKSGSTLLTVLALLVSGAIVYYNPNRDITAAIVQRVAQVRGAANSQPIQPR